MLHSLCFNPFRTYPSQHRPSAISKNDLRRLPTWTQNSEPVGVPGECGFGRWFLCFVWMFIAVYCQSLHNAPQFFCLVSLACDQHRLKYWPKNTCQQKPVNKNFRPSWFQKRQRSWNLTLPWVQVASTGLDNISSGRWSGANLQISQKSHSHSWFKINSKQWNHSQITVK